MAFTLDGIDVFEAPRQRDNPATRTRAPSNTSNAIALYSPPPPSATIPSVITHVHLHHPSASPSRSRLADFLTATIFLLTLLFYAPTLTHLPILLDDQDYIFNNPGIRQGITLATLKWALITGEQANWHPITWLSYALDWHLYGSWFPGYFATNIFLHAANTALVMALLVRLTGSLWRSLLVAFLFGLHPMHVESVAWLSQRKELLAAFFALLALWGHLDFTRSRRAAAYFMVTGCYALSLMSKQSWVTFPILLFLLDFWPLNRLHLTSSTSPSSTSSSSTRDSGLETRDSASPPPPLDPRPVLEKLPLFLLAFIACAAAFQAQAAGGAIKNLEEVTFTFRLQNAIVNYGQYFQKLFWPAPIAVYYPLPDHIPVYLWLTTLAFLALLTTAAIRLRRKYPWFTVGWFWFIIGLLPVVGFVQLSDQASADRYSYMPYLGLFIAVAWSLPDLRSASLPRKTLAFSLAAVVLIAMSCVTWLTLKEWTDTRTLFTAAAQKTRNNHLAYAILAVQEIFDGQTDQAVAHINLAVKLKPESPRINLAAGRVYLRAGEPILALLHLDKAVQANPDSPASHFEFALALSAAGRPDLALMHFRRTVELSPTHTSALLLLAGAYLKQGNLEQAEKYARRALIYARTDPTAWDMLGRILIEQHDFTAAANCFEKVLQLRPNDEAAQRRLELCRQNFSTTCSPRP